MTDSPMLMNTIDAPLGASIFLRPSHAKKLHGVACFVVLITTLTLGCSSTSGTVSLLETENRILKEHKAIQEQEIASYRRTTSNLAARLNQTEIELARTAEQVKRR